MHAQRTGTNAPQTLSFDHAETPRAQAGAQLAHVPISPAQLEYELNTWAKQGGADEEGNEAKQRILEAHRTRADQLNLSWQKLSTLPEGIGELANLQKLDLSGNKLRTLPESVGALTNLQELELFRNQLTTLPESIGNLTNLQNLSLYDNQLTTLPESIGNLTNLQKLELFDNQLTTLPESIGKLTNLQKLELFDNQLTTLPESIGKLTNLQELKLSKNQLTTLPESIGKLTNLQRLDLDINKITRVPESIGKLTNLHSLDLNADQLTTIPECFVALNKLQTLELHSKNLTALPENVEKLTNLQTLELKGKNLTVLSENIGKLINLQALRLEYNQLATLPENIGSLINLKILNADFNNLTTLPESIGKLTKLHKLYLRENQLTTLPESINKLTGLWEFSISNNPLEYLPSALADFQKQHDGLKGLPLREPAPSQASQEIPNIGPAELEALRNLKKLPQGLNSALADLQKIASMHGEQLHAVAQAQQGMVRLSALPENLASIPQCAQFHNIALQLLLRGWVVHEAAACDIAQPKPRFSVNAIKMLCDAVPLPGLSVAAFGVETLVNQIDTVMQANKGQLLVKRFNNSKVKFEQVAHTVASRCTELLESELSALPENNANKKPIGLGQRLKALYTECEVLAQRLKLQAKPLSNPQNPAANKADELMSLLLHKLCAQTVDAGRAGAIPQAHENNFAERMSNYCVELLLPNASNTLVGGQPPFGHKAFAFAPNVGSSQSRASSPPRSISPNTFARAMEEKDAELAKLKKQVTDVQGNASAKDVVLAKLKQRVTEVQSNVSGKDAELDKLKQRLTDVQSNVSGKDAELAKLKQRVTDVQANVSGKDVVLAKLKQRVTDVQGNVSGKDVVLAKLKQQVTVLQGNNSAKDAELAELKQQFKAMQDNMSEMVAESVAKAMAAMQKAEAASTLAETATRTASEVNQRVSMLGLSKQSAQQVQHNLGRLVLTQSSHGTHGAQSSMGIQPGMEIGQHRDQIMTLSERVDNLDHTVAELRQFDLLDIPLSAPEFGRVVTAYLQEHGRLHNDGTVALNNKPWGLKYRQLLEKLKDIHNTKNRGGDYKLGIELFALLKKMPDPARLDPRQSTNLIKLHQLIGVEKKGLKKPSDDPQKAL